jgi:uncharacterized protein (TIGR02145 family)
LPDTSEWNDAVIFAGGEETAAGKLKSEPPDWNGTDDFGFSAMPGGNRSADGIFSALGSGGYWWTATQHADPIAYRRMMDTGRARMNEYYGGKASGFSVRCLRED